MWYKHFNFYRAAILYARYKNTAKMLEAVDKFTNVSDRVDFLKKRGHIKEAAAILEENGIQFHFQ